MLNSADILQYGALGLLAIVLFAVARLVTAMLQRQADQSEASMQFVRDQIEAANEERKGMLEAWVGAHRDQIVAAVTTAEALGQIHSNLAELLEMFRKQNGKDK